MAEPLNKYPKNEDGTYVGLNFSDFPAQVDSWQDSLDVSSDMLIYVNQYRSAMESNNYSLGQQILDDHPDLKRMLIGAKDINEMKHGIMAIQRWVDENLQGYLGQYTESAQNSAKAAAASASDAAGSASESAQSSNAAYQAQVIAEGARDEANELVEDLRSLTGTLPSDFTEYVQQMDGVRDYVDSEITSHNSNDQTHEDLRNAFAKAQLDIQILKLNHETDITGNTFIVSFEDLDDVNVTKGTWDSVNDRIYF